MPRRWCPVCRWWRPYWTERTSWRIYLDGGGYQEWGRSRRRCDRGHYQEP